ncbi:GFA family protein [Legionella spiritensis]|uniref:GFA family protein n=1 Tax=Legionella spiritensis TaxID=452 RepID=UPI0007305879
MGNGTLDWEQGENICTDYEHEGTRFSKRCACPLPRIIDDENKLIQVPAGSLDGDQYFKPTAHIFTESKKCNVQTETGF